jgi:hypothetical protein
MSAAALRVAVRGEDVCRDLAVEAGADCVEFWEAAFVAGFFRFQLRGGSGL